jgi:hypothetical protein
MKHNVTVRQLATYKQGCWINVDDTKSGQIVLSGTTFVTPTYLMKKDNAWLLVVFDSEEWAQESLGDWTKHFDDVWKIEEGGMVPII